MKTSKNFTGFESVDLGPFLIIGIFQSDKKLQVHGASINIFFVTEKRFGFEHWAPKKQKAIIFCRKQSCFVKNVCFFSQRAMKPFPRFLLAVGIFSGLPQRFTRSQSDEASICVFFCYGKAVFGFEYRLVKNDQFWQKTIEFRKK